MFAYPAEDASGALVNMQSTCASLELSWTQVSSLAQLVDVATTAA